MNTSNKNFYNSSRVRKGFLHFLVGKGLSSVASFLVAIFIVRELSITDYASYTAISGLLITLMLVSNFGIERAVPRFLSEVKQSGGEYELKHLTIRLLKFRLFGLLISIGGVALFSSFLFNRLGIIFEAELLIGFCLYALAYGISMHLLRTLQALLMQKEATISMSIEWFSKLLLILFMIYIYEELSLENLIHVHAITIFISVCFALREVLKAIATSDAQNLAQCIVDDKNLYRFSLNNYLQTLAGFHCNASTNKLIGSSLLLPASVASLGFAYSITGVFKRYLPAQLFLGLIEPVIMGRYSKSQDFDEVKLYTGLLFKLNLFIVAPAIVWVAIDGKYLIELITKGKYGDDAWLISSLLIALILESQRGILQLISNSVNRSDLLLKTNIYTLLMFPVLLYLSHRFDLKGLISGIILLLFLRNLLLEKMLGNLGYKFTYDFVSVLKVIFTAILAIYSFSFVNFSDFIYPTFLSVLKLVFAYLVYLLVLAYFKPFSTKESSLLNNFVGKKVFVW